VSLAPVAAQAHHDRALGDAGRRDDPSSSQPYRSSEGIRAKGV
jgi:hypothetical protein